MKDVEVKIEPAEAVNRKVAKKIVALNWKPKRLKNLAILREFLPHEAPHTLIVKKKIVEIWIQELHACDRSLELHRQLDVLARLYQAFGDTPGRCGIVPGAFAPNR
jgi:hypothetical protein